MTEEKLEQEAVSEEMTELEALKAENEAVIKELDETKDKYLRLMAEYDNYRKRTAKERLEIYPEATARAVEAFLQVADDFENALNSPTADEAYKQGVAMIFAELGGAFKKLGVEVIDRVGEEFDPNLENAVNQIVDENLGENAVAQVFRKGYKLGDKVIRPAMVVVANC
ncbi:MAG: nucleotide exchange factor GrpE [Oscillospiraceae bacterium]|nr:nucleotide exchange factor GrpE [Oscillospiraceae bacterium]